MDFRFWGTVAMEDWDLSLTPLLYGLKHFLDFCDTPTLHSGNTFMREYYGCVVNYIPYENVQTTVNCIH